MQEAFNKGGGGRRVEAARLLAAAKAAAAGKEAKKASGAATTGAADAAAADTSASAAPAPAPSAVGPAPASTSGGGDWRLRAPERSTAGPSFKPGALTWDTEDQVRIDGVRLLTCILSTTGHVDMAVCERLSLNAIVAALSFR